MTREAVLRRDKTTQPAHGAGCVKEGPASVDQSSLKA